MVSTAQPPLLHPAPGISHLYDQRGNSATVYEVNPGMQWHSLELGIIKSHPTLGTQGHVVPPTHFSQRRKQQDR